MGWLSLFALAVALSMDAFAVAIVAGRTGGGPNRRQVFRLSFHFGLFQAVMPTLGWTAGLAVHRYIQAIDHWIAFGLLASIGGRMIVGAWNPEQTEGAERALLSDLSRGWNLVLLSLATSIDALAAGLSLALIGSAILVPAAVIGVITCGFTATGMLLGRRVGVRLGKSVEIAGGLVLFGLGVKIVVEHVFL
jgi:manganese efflux pump family protein